MPEIGWDEGLGEIVAWGPDNDQYEPGIPAGGTLEVLDDLPLPHRAMVVDTVLNEARTLRTKLLGVVDGLQASALATGNTSDATAIEAFKEGLRNITLTDLSVCVTEADMRRTILNTYKALAYVAPASVQLAFVKAIS